MTLPHLLVQVLEFLPRKFQLRNLRQYGIPPPTVNVSHKCLQTVHSIQRNLALTLQYLKGLVERILLAKLKHNLDDAAKGKTRATSSKCTFNELPTINISSQVELKPTRKRHIILIFTHCVSNEGI